MLSQIILGIWSGLGLIWWIVAWRLVTTSREAKRVSGAWVKNSTPATELASTGFRGDATAAVVHQEKALSHELATAVVGDRSGYLEETTVAAEWGGSEVVPPLISIFKPLPLLGIKGLRDEAAGLESFIAQLDEATELLLGIHEADRQATSPFVEKMARDYPDAAIKVIYRSKPDELANPKIAWQRILARHAQGELWLWSDADIVAPAGFLRSARAEYERSGAGMVTFPYIVREIPSAQALLDTLFVNVEFYPGLLLLQRLGPVDFGLGAAALFSRADFERRVDWTELGASLADDFVLGQQFKPVLIGSTTFVTSVDEVSWRKAVLHNLRWNKTILWNRPGGFAARLLILPVSGWLIYLALHPAQFFAWIGFLGMVQLDVVFAAAICWGLGCRIGVWNLLAMEGWSLWRIGVWVGCWLPWPVNWRGQLWWGPRKN